MKPSSEHTIASPQHIPQTCGTGVSPVEPQARGLCHSRAALSVSRGLLAIGCVVAAFGVWAHAQHPMTQLTQPEKAATAVRFAAVDVYVDSGEKPLAAYQFELTAKTGLFKIVGVEGGEHAAFVTPPYYDPAALSRNRIIIAAFNTGRDLPKGKTRVARIHVQISGNEEPQYEVRLVVAASLDGEKIAATATWSKATAANAAKQ